MAETCSPSVVLAERPISRGLSLRANFSWTFLGNSIPSSYLGKKPWVIHGLGTISRVVGIPVFGMALWRHGTEFYGQARLSREISRSQGLS